MTTAIVLISYNQEKYIQQALDGILMQDTQPDEVVIADDCSTDDTQFLISEYVRTNGLENRWKLLYNVENVGINRNLQNAIDHTTADIIIPMAGDDISLPNRCELTIKLFEQYDNLYIVTSSLLKIDSKGKLIGELNYQDEIFDDIHKVIKAGMPNVFPVGQSWRRTLFERFGPLLSSVPNEDDQITFWGFLSGGIFCSSVKTVKYRLHSNSASSWLRNNQSNSEYFSRFLIDMPIRKMHMKLWKQSLQRVKRSDQEQLYRRIELKEDIYAFLADIHNQGCMSRWLFLINHCSVACTREKYYLFFGRFGVLNWRWLRTKLKK